MLEAGKRVKYGEQTGIVTNVLEDMALVKMDHDNAEYSLPKTSLVIIAENAPKVYSKSQLKRMEFLNDFAKDLKEAGVNELVIRNGEIATFNATESLDEKIQKAKDEVRARHEQEMKEVEDRIKNEHEQQVQG